MTYEAFGMDVNTINANHSWDTVEDILRKSLNIKFEWSVLIDAQHIIDELQIMQEIFTQQITVMRDFKAALESISMDSKSGSQFVPSSTTERLVNLITDIEMRREELANLEKLQGKTRTQVNTP